jgi:hypothetical protein
MRMKHLFPSQPLKLFVLFFVMHITCLRADSTELQVEASGVGKNAEAALKNALANAVQQAVGAYVDQKTLIQNEAVIEDKILSVSAGFVQKYRELRPPRERSDGLWEAAIRAVVKKGEVGTALRSAGVMRVEADGRASWARQVTQIKGREDAMALIEKLVPELLANLVQGRIVGHSNTEDPKTGEQLKHVNIEYRINMEWWEKEGYPAWDAALSALQLGSKPPVEMDLRVQAHQTKKGPVPYLDWPRRNVSMHCFDLWRPGNNSGTVWKLKRYHLPDDWMARVDKALVKVLVELEEAAYADRGNTPSRLVGLSKLCFLGASGQLLDEAQVIRGESGGYSGYFTCIEAKPFFHPNDPGYARLWINSSDNFCCVAPFFKAPGELNSSNNDVYNGLPFVGVKATTQFTTKLSEQVMAEMRSIEIRAALFGVSSEKPGSPTPLRSTGGPRRN